MRRLVEQVAEEPRLAPALLPVGTGLLAAAVGPEEG
jgi:predicted O-methyltransferase YrrM